MRPSEWARARGAHQAGCPLQVVHHRPGARAIYQRLLQGQGDLRGPRLAGDGGHPAGQELHPVPQVHDHPLLYRGLPVFHQVQLCGELGDHLHLRVVGEHVAPVQLLGVHALQGQTDPVAPAGGVEIVVVLLDGAHQGGAVRGQDLQVVVAVDHPLGHVPQDDRPHALHVEVVVYGNDPFALQVRLELGRLLQQELAQLDGVVRHVGVVGQYGVLQQGGDAVRGEVIAQYEHPAPDPGAVKHEQRLTQRGVDLVHHHHGHLCQVDAEVQGVDALRVLGGLQYAHGVVPLLEVVDGDVADGALLAQLLGVANCAHRRHVEVSHGRCQALGEHMPFAEPSVIYPGPPSP